MKDLKQLPTPAEASESGLGNEIVPRAEQVYANDVWGTPEEWYQSPAYECPISEDEMEATQAEIDSIIGVTRGNKSIVKLIWNGDVEFWKEQYEKWDHRGKPVGNPIKRPWVLYATEKDPHTNRRIKDIFPPRFVLLTRIEPEQYHESWKRDAWFFDPALGCKKMVFPDTPPEDWYLWFETVADHKDHACCFAARADNRTCHGYYAHPRKCLDNLRELAKTMTTVEDHNPFASPDEINRRITQNAANNYEEQAMLIRHDQAEIMKANPLAYLTPAVAKDISPEKIQKTVNEAAKRYVEEGA